MDARTFDKAKLPSRHVTEGPQRATHRSSDYAMGSTSQQNRRPFVDGAICWNEAAPCDNPLVCSAPAVEAGVASGGSANAASQLPAKADECGIDFNLFDVAEIFKRTPYVADLTSVRRYVAGDRFEDGGLPLQMRAIDGGRYGVGD